MMIYFLLNDLMKMPKQKLEMFKKVHPTVDLLAVSPNGDNEFMVKWVEHHWKSYNLIFFNSEEEMTKEFNGNIMGII